MKSTLSCQYPAISMLPEPSVSNLFIGVISRSLERRGVDPSQLCAELDPSALSSAGSSRLRLSQLQALFARAVRLSGDPAFGLHVASETSEASLGLLAHLILHAPTLRTALQVCARFHALVIDDGQMSLSERDGTASLRCEFSRNAAFGATYTEFLISGLMRMLGELAVARKHVSAVYFEHARPAHHTAYTQVFGHQVQFEQPVTGIDFAGELLDRPRLLHQAELYQLFETHAERSLELLPQPRSLTQQLQRYLAAQPIARVPDLPQAARALNTSARSLRRRLAREGVSYRDIKQTALQHSATRLLRDPLRTLQEIAHALGFADASSFNRAYKRWAGLTPGQFRVALRERHTPGR